jgi:hypothetical protein
MIIPNKPYLLKSGHSGGSTSTLAKLSNPAITQNLPSLALSFGGDNLVAFSTI